MNSSILVVHHGYPGQFCHLLPRLAANGHKLFALVSATQAAHARRAMPDVPTATYHIKRGNGEQIHPWALDTESKMLRAEAAAEAAATLASQGFRPQLILGHPGWGELLALGDIWPEARQLHYVEFCYGVAGTDLDFHDPAMPQADWRQRAKAKMKNANVLLNLEQMEWGITPTRFQQGLIPEWARARTSVIHDGIDTQWLRPDPNATLKMPNGQVLKAGDPVVTFINRTFEPYRGVHVFMEALAIAQAKNPELQAILVGQDTPQVSYGEQRSDGVGWLTTLRRQLGPRLDWSRIHCLGRIPHPTLRKVYQVSAAHVYLTYPFVLSWSLLEAMSCGCCILSNQVAPVEEFISHGQNGLLHDFSDAEGLASSIVKASQEGNTLDALRTAARRSILDRNLDHRSCSKVQQALIEWQITAGANS